MMSDKDAKALEEKLRQNPESAKILNEVEKLRASGNDDALHVVLFYAAAGALRDELSTRSSVPAERVQDYIAALLQTSRCHQIYSFLSHLMKLLAEEPQTGQSIVAALDASRRTAWREKTKAQEQMTLLYDAIICDYYPERRTES